MNSVGRYEIRDCIGEGAMADVYRAYDPQIHRELAVKVLKPELCRNAELAARFLREARAAGALTHSNIVTIYDVGEAGGCPYIAMELLDGRPLETVQQALSPGGVVGIGLQLAAALQYAHGLGVVHRDIKPSNIMLGADSRSIKILDFGIARLSDVEDANRYAATLKTQIGQVLGTPRYMSPEQALGEEVDGRSDLFSVGLVLYELITGQKAFTGSNATTLGLQIALKHPAPIADLAPDCPRGLQAIVNKLLAKKPAQRFADGAQLVEALLKEQTKLALASQAQERKHNLPLQVRLTLVVAAITAAALLVGIETVSSRQYDALERMALTSGSSIASFVASNAALHVADNAARASEERDWTPLQGFVKSVAQDKNVQEVVFVDDQGVVRAASNVMRIGKLYAPPQGEPVVQHQSSDLKVAAGIVNRQSGFRFTRPIVYAGKTFGLLDISVSNAELEAAAVLSQTLLYALGGFMLVVVCAVSYAMTRLLAQPLRQLKAALRDGATGEANNAILHARKDEFGELFDAFNLFIAKTQERLDDLERNAVAQAPEPDIDATRIAAATPTSRRQTG